ncbi:LAFE_0D09428g1_1 [Lachancea fermentati]|uniref:LAFE_0D09428g1_1 n=1 Tax=Lachancea fermentati TaxID=4955 RepID=A0A1G4MBS8_LACFM|nr:LAFE_0D09428g1_1 [Lachancea fermentati]
MSSTAVREAAVQLVKTLQKFPQERIKHLVSFRDSQLERFKPIAGLETTGTDSTKKPTLSDIKDIINRTSGPLGLQKDLLKKVQEALPQEQFTAQTIEEQNKSLNNIMSNKYKTYYDVGNKLYEPQGNPLYYKRLLDEIEGKTKETFFTALRTVVFGK